MRKCFFILFFLLSIIYIFADQVEATNNGIANASPGDYIIRTNGEKIILKQADIDYAQNQFKMEYTQETKYNQKTYNESLSETNYIPIIIIVISIIIILIWFISKNNSTSFTENITHQNKTYIDQYGYRRFTDSNKLVHRYVVEKKLGRKLHPGEVVHHKNRNKLDNSSDNLQVFENQEKHHKYHMQTDWLFKLSRRMRF